MTFQTQKTARPLGVSTVSRSPALLVAWGLVGALSVLVFCLLSADVLGRRFIVGWTIGIPLIRLVPLAALLAGVGGFAMMLRSMGIAPRSNVLPGVSSADWRVLSASAIAGGIALSLAVVWVLRGFPNSSDSYDYLFQAHTFLAGRLWNPPPPLPNLFAFFNQLVRDGRWFGVYSPGWPLVLAGGMAMGLPRWLVSPLIGGLLLVVVHKLAMRRDGAFAGLLAVALVAISPFFLFNAASYFSHVPAAAAGLLFCWAAAAFLDRPRFAAAFLSGMALGALGLIRTVDVAIFALPFVGQFVWRAQARHYRLLPAIGAGGLPFLAFLLFYDVETLGSLLPSAGSGVRFGLSPVDNLGRHFTILHQWGVVFERLVSLAEWTSPLLVLGVAAAYCVLAARRRLSFLDFIFPSFVIAYLFIPFDGGAQYGPRYYFEAFPFLMLTLTSALVPALSDLGRPRRRAVAWFLLLAHGALCVLAFAFIAFWEHRLVDQRMDLYDRVRARHLHDAVVVIGSPTSDIYPMTARDLTRNGIRIAGPVIYVRDLPDELAQLRRLWPRRQFYLYTRQRGSAEGTLTPLPQSAIGPIPATQQQPPSSS